MIAHLNQYSYIYALLFIIIITLVLNYSRGKDLVIKYQTVIAYAFAIIQFAIFLYTTIFRLVTLNWIHILLHDLCPALSFFSIIAFIWNKEKLYKAIMPWLIIGSLVTMSTSHAPIFSKPYWLNSYLEHVVMLMQGILTYFWVSKYTKKELYQLLIFPLIIVIWNLISGLIPWLVTNNKEWAFFSTGLLPPSVLPGRPFSLLANISWMPYPFSTLIFYLIAVFSALLIALNKKYYPLYKRNLINWKEKIWASNFKAKKADKTKEKISQDF